MVALSELGHRFTEIWQTLEQDQFTSLEEDREIMREYLSNVLN
jgi:hypothetical protein